MPKKPFSQTSVVKCFVCEALKEKETTHMHPKVHLPVCDSCQGSSNESAKVAELLEGLAEGFTVGCI